MSETAEVQERQAAFWNSEGAARWLNNGARRSDPARSAFADRALERAEIRFGERVVEIGCGSGDATLKLADAIGPKGQLLAVDVSQMLADHARARLQAYANVRVAIGDAAAYPFEEGQADLLYSQFGVMFFADPVAAFANMRKALKPDGRLAFICWRAPEPNPVMDIVYRHIARPAPGAPPEPGPQALSDRERVRAILIGAGFAEPSFEGLEANRDIARGQGSEGALSSTLDSGPVHRILSLYSETVKAAIARDLRDYFASIECNGEILQPAWVWIVTARHCP